MEQPSISGISRLWYAGPNADKIATVLARFDQLQRRDRELLLLALDIEEGVLPRIHVGGAVSRQPIVNDSQLLSTQREHDYRDTIQAARASAAPSPSAPPSSSAPPSASSPPGAATAEAARATRQLARRRIITIGDVAIQDQIAMARWFPQFQLHWNGRSDTTPHWIGLLQPLDPERGRFLLQASYWPNPLSPLRMTVLEPALSAHAPHRYTNGDLCTFYPPSGVWERGRDEDDLVELIRFTVTWLVRYTCWMVFDGWWPGVDVPHDPEFLVATLRDEDPCPYHFPAPWATCCKRQHVHGVEQLR